MRFLWISSLFLKSWDPTTPLRRHDRDNIARSASSLKISKALAGTNWGFDKETLVHTYKAITRNVLNYGAPIWIPLAAPSTLAKLEVIQNAALWIASGNVLMAPISHLHSETKVLPLSMHLKLFQLQELRVGWRINEMPVTTQIVVYFITSCLVL